MMQRQLMIDLTYTAHGLVKTSTGIVIGGAYIPHVNHGLSADARRMQAAIVAHGRAKPHTTPSSRKTASAGLRTSSARSVPARLRLILRSWRW
jgi:hypothetical protein